MARRAYAAAFAVVVFAGFVAWTYEWSAAAVPTAQTASAARPAAEGEATNTYCRKAAKIVAPSELTALKCSASLGNSSHVRAVRGDCTLNGTCKAVEYQGQDDEWVKIGDADTSKFSSESSIPTAVGEYARSQKTLDALYGRADALQQEQANIAPIGDVLSPEKQAELISLERAIQNEESVFSKIAMFASGEEQTRDVGATESGGAFSGASPAGPVALNPDTAGSPTNLGDRSGSPRSAESSFGDGIAVPYFNETKHLMQETGFGQNPDGAPSDVRAVQQTLPELSRAAEDQTGVRAYYLPTEFTLRDPERPLTSSVDANPDSRQLVTVFGTKEEADRAVAAYVAAQTYLARNEASVAQREAAVSEAFSEDANKPAFYVPRGGPEPLSHLREQNEQIRAASEAFLVGDPAFMQRLSKIDGSQRELQGPGILSTLQQTLHEYGQTSGDWAGAWNSLKEGDIIGGVTKHWSNVLQAVPRTMAANLDRALGNDAETSYLGVFCQSCEADIVRSARIQAGMDIAMTGLLGREAPTLLARAGQEVWSLARPLGEDAAVLFRNEGFASLLEGTGIEVRSAGLLESPLSSGNVLDLAYNARTGAFEISNVAERAVVPSNEGFLAGTEIPLAPAVDSIGLETLVPRVGVDALASESGLSARFGGPRELGMTYEGRGTGLVPSTAVGLELPPGTAARFESSHPILTGPSVPGLDRAVFSEPLADKPPLSSDNIAIEKESTLPTSATSYTDERLATLYRLPENVNLAAVRDILPSPPDPFPVSLPETDDILFRVPARSLTDGQIDEIVGRTTSALNDYWAQEFTERGEVYNPANVVTYGGKSPISDPSVPIPPPEEYGPYGDPRTGITYIDRQAIRDLNSLWVHSRGEQVQMVVAHEIAHDVARQLGIYNNFDTAANSSLMEQQAQYLAGASLREAGLLREGYPEQFYYSSAAYGQDFKQLTELSASLNESYYTYPTGKEMAQSIYAGMAEANVDKGFSMLGGESRVRAPDILSVSEPSPPSSWYDTARTTATNFIDATQTNIARGLEAVYERLGIPSSALPTWASKRLLRR
ncbi:neutral zinc metallopeptidase [Candidatus Kaiserbacteria bacterium]|nr:neutral zinc metallopeptidase [Candidatus Kaiserbacteria bacterium]